MFSFQIIFFKKKFTLFMQLEINVKVVSRYKNVCRHKHCFDIAKRIFYKKYHNKKTLYDEEK